MYSTFVWLFGLKFRLIINIKSPLLAQEACCFTVGFFGLEAHFHLSCLAPCEVGTYFCIHLHAWPALPVYTTTLFIYYFSRFQHKCETILGDTSPANKMSHLYCHEKRSSCWKYLFPVAAERWAHSPPPPPLLLCAVCVTWYGKCDIYKEIIYLPMPVWVVDTAGSRLFGATSRMLPHSSIYGHRASEVNHVRVFGPFKLFPHNCPQLIDQSTNINDSFYTLMQTHYFVGSS